MSELRDDPTRRDERAAFRAFVRAHHPDLGGDPEVFRAGLAAYRQQAASSAPSGVTVPTVYHRRRGPGVLVDWWLTRRAVARRPPRVH
jgi:hypothetical protein